MADAQRYLPHQAPEVANHEYAQHAPEVDWARQAPEVYRDNNAAPKSAAWEGMWLP